MKISIAQLNCRPGRIKDNCSKIKQLAAEAKQQGSAMVVFPEMTDTGYDMSLICKSASAWPDGIPFTTLQNCASDLNLHIVCGLSEKNGPDIYNSIAVIDPGGNLLFKYRKTHLFPGTPVFEDKHLTAGNVIDTTVIGSMNWGFLICYDLRFPEVCRTLFLKGAEVMVICSAWPISRIKHWKTLTRARAIENQAYVLASNRIGTDRGLEFCGSSCIIDPSGETIAEADTRSEGLISAEISREEITRTRQKIPVSETRRPEIY